VANDAKEYVLVRGAHRAHNPMLSAPDVLARRLDRI
jgi:hypothetical protein